VLLSPTLRLRFTGDSSLVVRIDAETGSAEMRCSSLLTADFTFVARDTKSNLAVRVPQLLLHGEAQKSEWQMVHDRVALRKARRATVAQDVHYSFSTTASALIEQGRLLTELPGPSKGSAILSVATALENTFVTQPQTRNMSGRVFGGFLMKRAFELAFSTAYMFSGCRFGRIIDNMKTSKNTYNLQACSTRNE
jgi:acyl-coenzyme A thioesterase 9